MTPQEKPLIVIPGDDPVQIHGSVHLDRLRNYGRIELYNDHPQTAEERVRRASQAEVILNSRGSVEWPAEVLRKLPKLKMITTCGIGTDSIDLQAARDQGVAVCNIPARTAPVVAEHALALMLATARRVAFTTSQLKAGEWNTPDNTYLNGKTLGVIGTGSIGAQMIRLGQAIGMNVLAWTFHPSGERAEQLGTRYVELEELLGASDVVSVHVKLTAESRHLIGRREFSLMKPGSLLVNTARGAVVDSDALVEALQSSHLDGAGIDVFETEPLPADHPILAQQHVVLTPHSADQNAEGRELLNAGAVDNVIAFLSGEPRNVVN